jgi:hypothetical protein
MLESPNIVLGNLDKPQNSANNYILKKLVVRLINIQYASACKIYTCRATIPAKPSATLY